MTAINWMQSLVVVLIVLFPMIKDAAKVNQAGKKKSSDNFKGSFNFKQLHWKLIYTVQSFQK